MTNTPYPPHCYDDDGDYNPAGDLLDLERIDFELDTGIYNPVVKDRSEAWLLASRDTICARLKSEECSTD